LYCNNQVHRDFLINLYLFIVSVEGCCCTWPHLQTHTLCKTPLGKGSVRRRDLHLTTHNTHKRQTSMTPEWFKPVTPASESPQPYILYGAATGTCARNATWSIWHKTAIKSRVFEWHKLFKKVRQTVGDTKRSSHLETHWSDTSGTKVRHLLKEHKHLRISELNKPIQGTQKLMNIRAQ
jgi:hypothetical protein